MVLILVFTLFLAADAAYANDRANGVMWSNGGEAGVRLPLRVFNAKPAKNTVAIIYSGDAGWQNIDEVIGTYLQTEGIPVIGVSSLRYFWSERSPSETAKDLGHIIDVYTKHFGVQNVLLIGYSFGADVMPASFNRLTLEQKNRVKQISLLALSHQVDYVVSFRGWLQLETEGKGGNPLDDLRFIDPAIVQCMYGREDRNNACPSLRQTGAEVIGFSGGHHFGNDFKKLSTRVVSGLVARLSHQYSSGPAPL
ncbi:AcvB/VirJ family lysyl-phosphatidylglycerol hydrolase [Agrobacterium tumefaciens]|uniref:AcvB/VirJ family lysyl-phosphatidylglycerol hydrolase n=1 Tax=Agrobacterium tumefaciens TaxID=358 RepID=UPI0019690556